MSSLFLTFAPFQEGGFSSLPKGRGLQPVNFDEAEQEWNLKTFGQESFWVGLADSAKEDDYIGTPMNGYLHQLGFTAEDY